MTNEVKIYQLGYFVGTALLRAENSPEDMHVSDSELEKALILIKAIGDREVNEEIYHDVVHEISNLGVNHNSPEVIHCLKRFYDDVKESENKT